MTDRDYRAAALALRKRVAIASLAATAAPSRAVVSSGRSFEFSADDLARIERDTDEVSQVIAGTRAGG